MDEKNKPVSPPLVSKLNQPRPVTPAKPGEAVQTTRPGEAVTFGAPASIHQRVAQAKSQPAQPATSFAGFANMQKIVIFPDASGSMAEEAGDSRGDRASYRGSAGKTKIELLKTAVDRYLDDCTALNYVGIASFPEGAYESPTANLSLIRTRVHELDAAGGTPLEAAMGYVIDNELLTHGVIVSDGVANNPDECEGIAKEYKAKGIKLDCVFIGGAGDSRGEKLLQAIAEITGGIYVKFDNVENFAKAFSYLAPAKRGLLTSKSATQVAGLLGAAQVKL